MEKETQDVHTLTLLHSKALILFNILKYDPIVFILKSKKLEDAALVSL